MRRGGHTRGFAVFLVENIFDLIGGYLPLPYLSERADNSPAHFI